MPRWTPEEEQKLRELVATGQSYRVIGAHLGRAGDTVFAKAKAMGLGPKPLTGERSPTWIAILRICADGIPRTVHELAKATGAARHTVDCLFWERKKAKQAHVVRWLTGHGAPVPYWLPVQGRSARRPPTLTPAQVSKRFRDRLRENDPIAYRAYLARTTTRAALKAGRVKPQHAIVRALFGMGGTTS
ncbi:SANT/Myb-like DNA-binding domain-containing protein [Cupriavidus sp. a3]|uniref:SANT/Myb-like DNA-binding domain-containing protein n=1 Tax=Cupriavidus sp. a3 TaxID=3242158 RepID=UPI003D9C4CFC